MPNSIFTKIINREVPATIYFEDADFIVIKDIHPAAPVHALIIPKHPYQTLEDVDLEDTEFLGKLLQTARTVALQLHIANNYKLVMNVGKDIQAVPHTHLHLLGGWVNPSADTAANV